MLQRIREWLILVLIAALPFHALLVTVGTKIIAGPGHSPLPILVIWKEALLGVILLVAIVEWIVKWKMENGKWKMDTVDICIGGLVIWSLLQTVIFHFPFSIFHYALGFKYDFLPLVAFLILRRVPWSQAFVRTAGAVLLGVGAIVAVYGIATTFLPMSWFTALGYNDLHSLYIPGGPLAPFQQIEASGLRRIQSTFSGPNQLGLWLLIPLSLGILDWLRGRKCIGFLVCLLIGVSIVLTFSRSAWIGAAVILIVALGKYLPRERCRVAGCWLLVAGSLLIAMGMFFAPDVLLRATSSRDHIQRPLQALQIMKEHPWGIGLGSAGPTSNHFSDTCVDVPANADVSWAVSHPELCVFVAGKQVQPPLPSEELRPVGQPTDRTCSCPLLPENWYLQIGVELGWMGFVLFMALVVMLLRRLIKLKIENEKLRTAFSIFNFQFSIFLAFLGISIAALFLHAWEDSAVAYTVWILLAQGLRLRPDSH